jgi:murein DD-endopeptidase MepM/ murein hydrolase activator NlpD
MTLLQVARLSALAAALVVSPPALQATLAQPSFEPPGDLEPGSGDGLDDSTIYFPGIRFPIENHPAYANSQVYRPGGAPGGDQCKKANYSYPWRDTYCENRKWSMPLCPAGKGHQGLDIRPSTCKKDTHWAVAAADGVISQIGSFSVTLQTPAGTLYRYLHMNKDHLAVKELDAVKRGAKLGLVSNHYDGTPTTIHLHFDVKDNIVVEGTHVGPLFVPPYASVIEAYKSLLNGKP